MITVSRQMLHRLVDELPESELRTAVRILWALREEGDVDWAELRARLATFAEEWESPEMSIYDEYDRAQAESQSR